VKYIRPCPICNTELRFPLDMGTLIITCPNCSHSFRMDPDDPKTYQTGTFDLSPSKKQTKFPIPLLSSLHSYLVSKKDIHFLIPLLLFLLLLLNLIKIFNTPVAVEEEKPERQEYFEESPEAPPVPTPEKEKEPSIEI